MARSGAIARVLKSVPGQARMTHAPQSGGFGGISAVQANSIFNNPYQDTYGPFLPRPSQTFTDGAFGPMPPIQPVPVDEAPVPGGFPDPRWWQYRTGWNLPTQPGSEGLKLASFDQLRTLAERYSVARTAINLRIQEIRGLNWEITLTSDAAKAYQNDHQALRDFGERKAQAVRFFNRPDPDFWTFDSFLNAMLEEIFVYDALAVIFRPKYGASFGRGGKGLLGSDLDSLNLVSGPTIRPLVDMHGGHPRPPAPAYQQYLYGVPRSDYMTIATNRDLDDNAMVDAQVNEFRSDVMLYAPFWPTRESPYGRPPIEQALLPIVSGLQKQEFQLDYFTEGTIPGCYISPGDPNITPTQIGELQNALNAIAGDPAYHLKVIVLPPGSKVEPQRPIDMADSFDFLVMNQVLMAFDIQPQEMGIIPDVSMTDQGPSASGIRFAGQQKRDIKSRTSTKPLLKWICSIFNHVLQDICGQPDMQFAFEGLVDDEDKAAITELGVQQVQNAISSIDEIRERLDLPPWGLQETSEPVVFTAQGPIPLSMAPELIASMQAGAQGGGDSGKKNGQGTNSGQRTASSRSRTSQPSVRRGGQTKPNGSHPAPLAPHREGVTPAHAAAAGALQSSTPRTGGTTSRSSVAGSRKKAAASELDSLRRHLGKGKLISDWEPRHITNRVLGMIAEDMAKGVLIDVAVNRAAGIFLAKDDSFWSDVAPVESGGIHAEEPDDEALYERYEHDKDDEDEDEDEDSSKSASWPGWEHDLGLVGAYRQQVSRAFQAAEVEGRQLRKDAATGKMFVSSSTLNGLVSDIAHEKFIGVLTPLWAKAWNLGYESASSLVSKTDPDFSRDHGGEALDGFIGTEGAHWLEQIARTGLKNSNARSEVIARTEVARAVNAAAEQAYKDNGVSHKQLLVAPDDRRCETCRDAKRDGIIPLDAPFSPKGGTAPFHPDCRCVSGPAGIDVAPPLANLKKSADDDANLAWLLLRAKDENGKYRFLLQQRTSGEWGMPGGKLHEGENPWTGAVREVTEEIGDLPPLKKVRTFHHVEDDGKTQVYLWLCDTSYFHPEMNGKTPEETQGAAWFRKKEIGKLNLTPKFREDWEKSISLEDHATKGIQRMVNENGETVYLDTPGQALQAVGSRWPYPHRPDGTEDPEQEWPDSGPGNAKVPDPVQDDFMNADTPPAAPRGGSDGKMPRRRKEMPPASRFPDQGDEEQDMWPEPRNTLQAPATGIPGGKKNDEGQPFIGTTAPKPLKPYAPHSVPAEAYDPGSWVEELAPEDETTDASKGAEHNTDPNPVHWRHVYAQLQANFPDSKLEWVKRARWIGPVNIPWSRVDTDDIGSWAASHEPKRVQHFMQAIRSGDGNTAPSVMVQESHHDKAFLVDGHHRAIARHKLNMPVLAYVGNINPEDREAAEELHSSQVHQGNDPGNK